MKCSTDRSIYSQKVKGKEDLFFKKKNLIDNLPQEIIAFKNIFTREML